MKPLNFSKLGETSHVHRYSQINTVRVELEALEQANNQSIIRLNQIKKANVDWKDRMNQKLVAKINQVANQYENIILQAEQQLMTVKGRINLAHHQLEINLPKALSEIEKIDFVLSNSNLIQNIIRMDSPSSKDLDIIDVSNGSPSKSCKDSTFYLTRNYNSIQNIDDFRFQSLNKDYQRLTEQYSQLVQRIVNFEQRGILKQIISEQKLQELELFYKEKKQKQHYESLVNNLKIRKQSLNRISNAILNGLTQRQIPLKNLYTVLSKQQNILAKAKQNPQFQYVSKLKNLIRHR